LPVLFLAFWIILNARVTVEVVAIGLFVSAVMSLFTYRLIGISFREERKIWATYGRSGPVYLALLLRNIIKANVQMVRLILSPHLEQKPQIVYFTSPVDSDFAKILMMYSIQLTPGTVLCELEEDRVGIHAITPSVAAGIDDTNFIRKLRQSEGRQRGV